ncbi:MAB_1171c family putative transporter [Streptomyces sp. MUM 178J]|uniref:MAB_1171c family putative transporter n=1 Tax=Streptomyces sp. MUM 178J TaxID=2791991 RepID=UPI001F041442|nr:MAB_1171c family putative transporter [Streptomyces sp. MUM 178J]WRQ82452.1 MAB_1171c family putative transporter [Streptomyces sp. MUM 178J]
MRNTDYYVPAVALGIAFLAKLPALRRGWRDPLVRSVHFLIFTAACCFLFAAPPTIRAVNDLTGVPNVSAPLVYSLTCAFSCACLLLIVNWRGGAPEAVRARSRAWSLAYAGAITALPVFFLLGDAPVERLRDLDTYYATTPYIREMIVTYLTAHMVSAVVTTTLCLRWAREVRQWLRAGLIVLVVGFVLNLLFGIAKLAAVAARWTGRDWDALSTSVAPPIVAAGGLIVTVGFLLPLLGPQLGDACRAWTGHVRLGPLWRLLRCPARQRAAMPQIPWWSAPDMLLTVRETVIHDELLRLQPYLDDLVRRRAHDTAVAGGAGEDRAAVLGVAAMVAAAVESRSLRPHPGTDSEPQPDSGPASDAEPDSGSVSEESSAKAAVALTAVLSPGRQRLVQLSNALQSPIVAAARQEAAPRESSPR